MKTLAINGGQPVRDVKNNPWPKWPVWDHNEEKALLETLNSGVWSYNGPKETEFNRLFAEYTGVKYAISAANGTVTLQMALEACGIGVGNEVILPGLTWQATAATIADVNAMPVLVDVCEDTWCIDPAEIGIEVAPSYIPLNNCSLYVPLTKPARHKLNEQYWSDINPARFELPVCDRIYSEESVCIHHKILMGTRADIDMIASAIRKIYDN